MSDENKPKRPAAKRTTKKDKPEETPIPPFGEIDEKALRRAAAKLMKDARIDQYKVSKIVRDVNGDDYGSVNALLWHLVEHGALKPEGHGGVLYLLSESTGLAKASVVFDMLTRMGPHLESLAKSWSALLPDVPLYVDALVADAWQKDSALFDARANELDPRLQLEVAFVRRRFERDIDPADAEKILDHLAHQMARGELTGNHELPVSRGGELVVRRLNGEDALIETALLVGTEEAFLKRAIAHALTVEEPGIRALQRALKKAPLTDAAEVLARCYSWGDTGACERELALLESRADSPETLFTVAEELVPGKTRGKYDDDPDRVAGHRLRVRDGLLALGAARFGAENKPIPARFEELYTFEGLSDVYYPTVARHFAAYRALGRDRSLALADKLIAKDYGYASAAVLLAAHPDEERLRKLLVKARPTGYIGPRYLGLHGASIVPLLEAEVPHTQKDRRGSLATAILFAIGTAAKQGTPVDPAWTSYLRWDANGPDALKYWSTSSDGPLRDDALDAFPADVRRSVLLRAATEEPYPARVLTSRHVTREDPALLAAITAQFVEREGARAGSDQINNAYSRLGSALVDALCEAVAKAGAGADLLSFLRGPLSYQDHQRLLASVAGKTESIRDVLVRKAAAAPGPKRRVYALDPDGEHGFAAKEGSLSRIGGSVPGLAESDYPKAKGEPMTPVLTFDLDELPELARPYGDARLLVLFHPDPEGGEDHEDAVLVAIPRASVTEGGDGAKMAVTPLDLPAAVFRNEDGSDGDGDEEDEHEDGSDGGSAGGPDVQDLRRMLWQRGGHVFGGPFWIQEAEGGEDGFLFQLNDGLCDMNLGDVGSLYAYENDQFCFQCH